MQTYQVNDSLSNATKIPKKEVCWGGRNTDSNACHEEENRKMRDDISKRKGKVGAADRSHTKLALPLRGRDVLVQEVLPTAAHWYEVAVSEFEEHLRGRDTHGLEELVSNGVNELGHACIQYFRVCFASGSLVQGTSGALVACPLWVVSRHPGRVQNPSAS